jgi:single-strand DNA-binding protein
MKTTVITMGTLIRKNTFNGLRKVTLALKERVGEKQISRYLSGKVANTIPQSMFEDMKEGNVFLATGTLAYSEYETDDGKEKTSLEPTYLNFVPVCKDDLEFATDNAGNSVLIGGINEVTLEGGLTKDVEFKDISKGENSYQLLTGRVGWEEAFPRGRDTVYRKHYATFEQWGAEAVKYATLSKGQRVVLRGAIVNDSFDGEDGEKKYVTKIGVTQLIPCERTFRGSATHHASPQHADQPPRAAAVKAEDVTGVI